MVASLAYIQIANGDIQVHAPKHVCIKGAFKSFSGGASMAHTFNERPQTAFERKTVIHRPNGEPARNTPYEFMREGEGIVRGMTDGEGQITLQQSDLIERLQIKLLRNKS